MSVNPQNIIEFRYFRSYIQNANNEFKVTVRLIKPGQKKYVEIN